MAFDHKHFFADYTFIVKRALRLAREIEKMKRAVYAPNSKFRMSAPESVEIAEEYILIRTPIVTTHTGGSGKHFSTGAGLYSKVPPSRQLVYDGLEEYQIPWEVLKARSMKRAYLLYALRQDWNEEWIDVYTKDLEALL